MATSKNSNFRVTFDHADGRESGRIVFRAD